ncbi:MAG: hypothetical protein HY741_09855 [Chloroflexi bacterium]|nr:hypothetical protein [Chloroflexota bacterium]
MPLATKLGYDWGDERSLIVTRAADKRRVTQIADELADGGGSECETFGVRRNLLEENTFDRYL